MPLRSLSIYLSSPCHNQCFTFCRSRPCCSSTAKLFFTVSRNVVAVIYRTFKAQSSELPFSPWNALAANIFEPKSWYSPFPAFNVTTLNHASAVSTKEEFLKITRLFFFCNHPFFTIICRFYNHNIPMGERCTQIFISRSKLSAL